jgi:AcrR family transcriptional regulator
MTPESRVDPSTTAPSDPPTARAAGARPTTPRPASTARRTEIIGAAIRVIARDGIRACTVSALEQETGFARGHFTYHFNSKEEIIALAFATVGSDWATNMIEQTTGATARQRLERQVRAATNWSLQRPEYFRCLMTFRVEMMRDSAAFPRAPEIRAQFLQAAAATIRVGVTEGDFRRDLDADAEARMLFGVVDGFTLHAALDPTFSGGLPLADRVWGVVADRLLVPPR